MMQGKGLKEGICVAVLVALGSRVRASDCDIVRPGECFCVGEKQNAVVGHFDIVDGHIELVVEESFSRGGPPAYAVGSQIILDPQISFDSRDTYLATETDEHVWVFDLIGADGTLNLMAAEARTDQFKAMCVTPVDASDVAAFEVTVVGDCEGAAKKSLHLAGGRDCDADESCAGARNPTWLLGLLFAGLVFRMRISR